MSREDVLRELASFRPAGPPTSVPRTELRGLITASLETDLERAVQMEKDAVAAYGFLAASLDARDFTEEADLVEEIRNDQAKDQRTFEAILRRVRGRRGTQ